MIYLLFACSDPIKVNIIYPDLIISEQQIDFAEVEVHQSKTLPLSILNSGAGPLRISEIAIEDASFPYTLNFTDAEISSDELSTLEITFLPTDFVSYNTNLIITSNDEDNPSLSLPLLGYGGDGPTPDIHASSSTLDFGSVSANETKTLYFTVSNQGDGVLQIQSTTQNGSGAFSLIGDLDGQNLSPQVETGIIVSYTPTHELGDSGSLLISSNDPDEENIQIDFIGNGGTTDSYPIASITCPSSVDVPTEITLDGSASSEPGGGALVYNWTIEQKPQSSQAVLRNPTDVHTSLNVDVAGNYQINLRVQNEVGILSPPAECLFYAEPPADIHIELSWEENGADMDLHMTNTEMGLFSFESDCCWCNPNPEWNTQESQSNPLLSVDSSTYITPEIIDVWMAEARDYYVYVHYFSDLGVGQTQATIRIYLQGVLVGQYSQNMIHNQIWDVGFVRWSTGYFIDSNSTPIAYEGLRSCQ